MSSLDSLRELTDKFKVAVAEEDFATAEAALKSVDQKVAELPDGWQDDEECVALLLDLRETLELHQQQLEQSRGDTKQQIDRLGKSKKGVKAYTK